MNTLLTKECFFICLHNRLRSPDWSGWLQKCEDFDRGFCFFSANRLKTRTYCSNNRGKEQWSWTPGVWEFWLIRGGTRPLSTGINTQFFDDAVSSFINHVGQWDHDAQCTPLSDFDPAEADSASVPMAPAAESPTNPRESRWRKLREFSATWDSESELRKRCFEANPIDWQGIVASCKRMAVCLITCPDSRLRRIARLAKLPPDLDLNNPDTIIYCVLGPWCPYVGQCAGRKPRAPILRYAEHAQRAKSLIRHFLGTRHRILRANAGFGKTPSLARILAAKGPVSGIMFPIERATTSNIDSRERFYDSLFAPTSSQIQPRGSLNDALWLNVFNH